MKLEIIDNDFISTLTACFKKDKKLYRKIDALQAKLDKNEKIKSKLAYKLHKQFVKNNIGKLNEHTPYYRVSLDSGRWTEVIVTRLKYDNEYIPGYSDRYAVFHPLGRSNVNVHMEFNINPEDYDSTSVVIDQEQLDLLANDFSIKHED